MRQLGRRSGFEGTRDDGIIHYNEYKHVALIRILFFRIIKE
jgi:hypothetical protein